MKRIKALNKSEFNSAKSYGVVYAIYKGLYVYIELGQEREYIEKPKDDPKTEYKLFRQCHVEYSQTQEQVEQGIYQYDESGIDVILYW